jgi:hypothetical protein
MYLLPFFDVLEASFTPHTNDAHKKAFNAVFNTSTTICLSKKYIDYVEKSITNLDVFQAMIKELYDNNRIFIFNPQENDSMESEFVAISTQLKNSKLIPFCLSRNESFSNDIPNLLVMEFANPINKHWIKLELLSKNSCNVSYRDFESDEQIQMFFNSVFEIPNYITKVCVYDREIHCIFLESLKGKNIDYYSFCDRRYLAECKDILKSLKQRLGGKTKLFLTTNPRILHERKILFEDFIVTIDNSRSNLTTKEPTWEIFISYDTDKSNDWKIKGEKFRLFN